MEGKNSKKKVYTAPKGMHDILPDEQVWWDRFYNKAKDVSDFYGFKKIDTPLLEDADIFIRGTGLGTDIVEKEMYTLKTKGGDFLALRPEGTPSVIRSYIENGMFNWPQPVKLFYYGPMFRYDKPQAGRYRQLFQFGLEMIGEENAAADAEIIQAVWLILNELGIKNIHIELNSIGCPDCRPAYKKFLKTFYRTKASKLCSDCKRRLKINPLRILDCKNESCIALRENLPPLFDKLCEECRAHFEHLLEYLDEMQIPYNLNPNLVRGLDYYTKTVFEVWSNDDAGSLALGGGGRYDGLVGILGGPKKPAVGFAFGVDRIVYQLKLRNKKTETYHKNKVYLVQLGESAKKQIFGLLEEFRKNNILVESSLGRDSLRSQLKNADHSRVKYCLILGQREVIDGTVILRDMESGLQETIPIDKIILELKERLKKEN